MDTINEIPADGVEFELTMSKIIDPLEMVRAAGHKHELWKFRGRPDLIPRTARFKLVRIPCRMNFYNVPRSLILMKYGFIPEGQWQEVFRTKYQLNDGRGPIGVPNASWVHLYDGVCFPILDGRRGEIWCPGFSRVRDNYGIFWRWLVASKQ